MMKLFRPTWIKGFGIKSDRIRKNKVILKISCGEAITLHKELIDGAKIKIKLTDIKKAYLKQNALVYFNGKSICWLIDGLPMECANVMLLYSVDILIFNGKITDVKIEDLRALTL